ncbi:MAG: LysM peptidoglycan-binding domain-containing protein [Pseudomonadota bacterium]|nr:LysM peptidoglycan-binding domain-containing protein [Pseudomonadota bacterium]
MNRPLVVGIVAAAVVLAAMIVTLFIDRKPDSPLRGGGAVGTVPSESDTAPLPFPPKSLMENTGDGSVSVIPKPTFLPLTPVRPAIDASPLKTSLPLVPKPSGPTEASSGPASIPLFDVVRVGPQGNAVIAGRAPPNASVTIRQGNRAIGIVQAGRRGKWVFVPKSPFGPGTHELGLIAQLAGGVKIPGNRKVVIVVPVPGKDVAGRDALEKTGSLVMALSKQNGDPPIVLQTPGANRESDLSLTSIDYGAPDDDLTLSGRAPSGAEVRVYLNNKFIGRSIADGKGVWTLKPEVGVSSGPYRMRVDRVDQTGKITARIELSFLRAKPVKNLSSGRLVFIQPGNNLWRLARKTYGSGLRYTDIFEANKDQIRDPDLIYPGQVFVMPRKN